MNLNSDHSPQEELLRLDKKISALRQKARQGRDPTCADETLNYLLALCKKERPGRILEIGTAQGLTAVALLSVCDAEYVGIELDPVRAAKAFENFQTFQFSHRTSLFEGDAGEILPMMNGQFDLIFLDGPKVQYFKYFPDLKRLLRKGGFLLSDDILLFGWVMGEAPKKRHMLVQHIREYLSALQHDSDFVTEILNLGEGLAVSRKIN